MHDNFHTKHGMHAYITQLYIMSIYPVNKVVEHLISSYDQSWKRERERERERERDTERERETDRQTDTQTHRETETERQRQRDRDRENSKTLQGL